MALCHKFRLKKNLSFIFLLNHIRSLLSSLMNKNLQNVFHYHEETKHSHLRYARSLGYMDWANQPNPYRTYKGALNISLPLATEYPTPPYSLIFTNEVPAAPLLINSISQFLQFSMGISAIKSNGVDDWDLRCNASSGNLHPTESYLILPPIEGVENQTTISHYLPKTHSLESLTSFDSGIWKTLPENSFFVAISSILYREVWKYGERAFRYTQLDAGHALRSIQVSAKVLGWKNRVLNDISDADIAQLLGLNQKLRFNEDEDEIPDMLLLITTEEFDGKIDYSELLNHTQKTYNSVANHIAFNYQKWPLITQIEEATFSSHSTLKEMHNAMTTREPSLESKKVILSRRSAQMMDREHSEISYKNFMTLIESTKESFNGFENSVNLVLFVHNVTGLKQGLYILLRNKEHKSQLMELMDDSFLWQSVEDNLYALSYDDFQVASKKISCNQDIAGDGAFSLGMLSAFSDELITHGAHRYKELYWECGAIGQQLYLEATSLGLSATGIGCFLDDSFHKLLGLESNRFQSLYHFTIGRGLFDKRVLSKKPYADRE